MNIHANDCVNKYFKSSGRRQWDLSYKDQVSVFKSQLWKDRWLWSECTGEDAKEADVAGTYMVPVDLRRMYLRSPHFLYLEHNTFHATEI